MASQIDIFLSPTSDRWEKSSFPWADFDLHQPQPWRSVFHSTKVGRRTVMVSISAMGYSWYGTQSNYDDLKITFYLSVEFHSYLLVWPAFPLERHDRSCGDVQRRGDWGGPARHETTHQATATSRQTAPVTG